MTNLWWKIGYTYATLLTKIRKVAKEIPYIPLLEKVLNWIIIDITKDNENAKKTLHPRRN